MATPNRYSQIYVLKEPGTVTPVPAVAVWVNGQIHANTHRPPQDMSRIEGPDYSLYFYPCNYLGEPFLEFLADVLGFTEAPDAMRDPVCLTRNDGAVLTVEDLLFLDKALQTAFEMDREAAKEAMWDNESDSSDSE